MHLRSLAHRTDLILARFESELESGQDESGLPYLCIRTPRRPDYFWGNTLIFAQPPGPGDLAHWQRVYRRHFASEQGFMTFSWDAPGGEEGELEPFLAQGFVSDRCVVLVAEATQEPLPNPARFNPDLAIRPLSSEADWQAAVEVHLNGLWKLNPEHQRGFIEGQMQVARQMVNAGLGQRFGAFYQGQLVGDLGIYTVTEDRPEGRHKLGRFHEVATHGDYFRQGVCTTLMHVASNEAFANMGVVNW